MRAVIVSGGTPPSKELLLKHINKDDLVIGVDKGVEALINYDLEFSIALGDFDSINVEYLERIKKGDKDIRIYNSEKDYTDTHIGYLAAIEKGASEILLFGATGTRVDHMLGNIGLFNNSLKDKVSLKIIDDNNYMYVIDKKSTLKGAFGETISFHALSDKVTNLSISGAKYTLDNYDMILLEPRAICNEFLDEDIEISFDKGIILVNYPKE